jgi:hypothetical protein
MTTHASSLLPQLPSRTSLHVKYALGEILLACRPHTSYVPPGDSKWTTDMVMGLGALERQKGYDALVRAMDALVSTAMLAPKNFVSEMSVGPWTVLHDTLESILRSERIEARW